LKKTLQALIASIGCTPLLAVGLFVTGAFIGELIALNLPAPPQWLLISAVLLPVFTTLYVRAYIQQQQAGNWLDRWRQKQRRKIAGYSGEGRPPATVEELWLQDGLHPNSPPNLVQAVLNNVTLWGWGVALSALALAYICIWFGLMVT